MLLVAVYLEVVRVTLVGVSCVCPNKAVESLGELLLADVVTEVVPFEVADEDVAGDVLDALDFSTLIQALT